MHIVILTYGSRGDVQPYIALAHGLQAEGYQVSLAAPENFKSFIEGYQVDFLPLYGNPHDLLKTKEGKKIIQTGSTVEFIKYMHKAVHAIRFPLEDSILEACQSADFIIVNNVITFQVACVAEKLKIPFLILQLNPPIVPTGEFPALDLNISWLKSPSFNKLTYEFLNWFAWQVYKKDINEWRQRLGLKKASQSMIKTFGDQKIPLIHSYCPHVIERPKDWDPQFHVSGYMYIKHENRLSNSEDLLHEGLKKWVLNGEKPVYFGFGSIPVPDPQEIVRMVENLMQQLNMRAIICAGWSDFHEAHLNEHIRIIKSTNHDELFPLCSCAIVHGGAGTTAAVMRAGIPVIVCSMIADQPLWGKIIENLGVGTHLPFQKMSEVELKKHIKMATSEKTKSAAKALGQKLKVENGVENAVAIIKKYAREF